MNIRFATINDLAALVNIYNQAIAAGQKTADLEPVTVESRRKWFEAHLPDSYPILVAEFEGKVVGYLCLSPYRPGRDALRFTAEVSYYVHFDYHRQGIASALMQRAIRLCPSLHIKTLFAILLESNRESIGLLKKFGFAQWGYLPRVADFNGVEVGHVYYVAHREAEVITSWI